MELYLRDAWNVLDAHKSVVCLHAVRWMLCPSIASNGRIWLLEFQDMLESMVSLIKRPLTRSFLYRTLVGGKRVDLTKRFLKFRAMYLPECWEDQYLKYQQPSFSLEKEKKELTLYYHHLINAIARRLDSGKPIDGNKILVRSGIIEIMREEDGIRIRRIE